MKIVCWVTRLPPKEIVDDYNKLRTANALALMQKHKKEKEEFMKSPNKWETMVEKYGSNGNAQSEKTLQEIVHDTGLSEYYVRKLKTTMGA
jgi:hypothetical protein